MKRDLSSPVKISAVKIYSSKQRTIRRVPLLKPNLGSISHISIITAPHFINNLCCGQFGGVCSFSKVVDIYMFL